MNYENTLLDDYTIETTTPYASRPVATRGKRFANYILDTIGYYLFCILFGIALALLAPEGAVDNWADSDDTIWDTLFGLAMYLGYYLLTEELLNGKSLGKFVTRTRAVREDGEPVTFQDVFLRSLSRLVPFEQFSFLGNSNYVRGWHDKWTKTIVVED